MTEAIRLLSMLERGSDEYRQGIIARDWSALLGFMMDIQQQRTFGSHFRRLGYNGGSFSVRTASLPESLRSVPMIFTGPSEDKNGGRTYGAFAKSDQGATMVFHFADPEFMDNFPKYCGAMMKSQATTFAHEYTHFLDNADQGGRLLSQSGSSQLIANGDAAGYYNNPEEVNAHFAQYLSEVKAHLQKIASLPPRVRQASMHLRVGLNFKQFLTRAFGDMLPKMNPQNRQRIIKRAATVWDELQPAIQDALGGNPSE